MSRRSGSQRGKAEARPTPAQDPIDPPAGSRKPNRRGKTAGRSVLSQSSADTMGQPPASELRHAGANFPRWLPFPAGDAAYVVVLLFATTLAWCSANAKWTAGDWNRPTAYLGEEKCDVLFTLAIMKAGAAGQLLPLAWKHVKELGAPYDANWNDWPMIEEFQFAFFGLLAKVFGLFAGLNLGILIGNLLATTVFYTVCRASDCNRPWSAVAGLAFGISPYTFAQSPHHIICEYVWHIPLFLLVWKWVAKEPGIRALDAPILDSRRHRVSGGDPERLLHEHPLPTHVAGRRRCLLP